MTKRILFILCAIFGLLLVLLVTVPFLFKDKVKEAVLKAANEQLNAEVSIGDFRLSLIPHFPDMSLTLEDAMVVGKGDFANDTLLQARSAGVTIDLYSLFGDKYKIVRVDLDRLSVYAKILADGRPNWDIVKEGEASRDTTAASPFNMSLKKITVKDCNIVYDDLQGKMKAVVHHWNGTLSGDFSSTQTTLKTNSEIDELSYFMNGIPYLNKANLVINAGLAADMEAMKFTFTESDLQLNALKAFIEGTFAMVGEDGMDFDLRLNAPDTQFKEILSLVPAMYTADFKDVKTNGSVSLDGWLKGLMQGDNYPAFDFKILVDNAMFQYPSLPKSVDNINVNLVASSKGGSLDNTVVDISKFSFTLGGNPFNGNLRVTTPMSDPNLRMQANGTLDLGVIKDVYPLEKGMELNGKVVADMAVAAALSAIEKEQYDKVSASGTLTVNNMLYKSPGMSDVQIQHAALTFTPQYANLTGLDVNIGKNDLHATGRLENFIGYALKDQTLKGELNLKSNYLNANDFLSEETVTGQAAEITPADTASTATEDIIIPKNIDFALNANMKQIVYDKINITNLVGGMTVRNGILSLKDVNANALGGTAKVSGSYDTSDEKKPKVDFNLNLSKVSFAETFKSVESIQKFAPIFENLLGTYSMNLNFNTSLGDNILQTLAALTGNGLLQTSDMEVQNVAALTALSSALKTDALKSFSTKDLNLPFTINEGKINTKPFTINTGNGGMLKLEGSTGLDQSIAYKGTVTLPKSLANSFINNVPITIGGTFTSPKIGVDIAGLASGAAASAIDQFLNKDKAEGDSTRTDLNAEKAKQIENIRAQADSTAGKLVSEAEKQAKALEDKASNPITKAAAKVAGQKLVDEAKKQAQSLRNQAEEQIKKLE